MRYVPVHSLWAQGRPVLVGSDHVSGREYSELPPGVSTKNPVPYTGGLNATESRAVPPTINLTTSLLASSKMRRLSASIVAEGAPAATPHTALIATMILMSELRPVFVDIGFLELTCASEQ